MGLGHTETNDVDAWSPKPEGPCTHNLGTWDLGNSNYGTGLGYVYDYWVLGPLRESHQSEVRMTFGWESIFGTSRCLMCYLERRPRLNK